MGKGNMNSDITDIFLNEFPEINEFKFSLKCASRLSL